MIYKIIIFSSIFFLLPNLTLGKCPSEQLVNVSKEKWNDYDHSYLKYARKRCAELYGEKSKCVILFRKFDKQAYTVICGEER